FIAAILAVPLLNEPLSLAMVCGLIGMAIGALQPWRWLQHQDSLAIKLEEQKKQYYQSGTFYCCYSGRALVE
ncbi:hypothetical protein BUE68_12695, partial [Corynebacterium diphtheriae]